MEKVNKCVISDRTCFTPNQCDNCQVKISQDLGFETLKEPTEFGEYLCRCQFYKDKNDIVEEKIEWYDEWKITDTWNVLGWRNIEK